MGRCGEEDRGSRSEGTWQDLNINLPELWGKYWTARNPLLKWLPTALSEGSGVSGPRKWSLFFKLDRAFQWKHLAKDTCASRNLLTSFMLGKAPYCHGSPTGLSWATGFWCHLLLILTHVWLWLLERSALSRQCRSSRLSQSRKCWTEIQAGVQGSKMGSGGRDGLFGHTWREPLGRD